MKTRIVALALAIPLMGCASTGTNPNAVITQIQNLAVQVCGYLPAASSIATLISTTVGGGTVVGQAELIAQQICAAATAAVPPVTPTPKSTRLRGAQDITVIVNGIPVTGHFVR